MSRTFGVIETFRKRDSGLAGAIQLADSKPCHRITIRNYGEVTAFLGKSDVLVTTGFPLKVDESITLEIDNANKLYYMQEDAGDLELRVLIEREI